MKRISPLASTAIGLVLGAVVFGAAPTSAQMPVVDWTTFPLISTISSVIKQVNSGISSLQDGIGSATNGSVTQLLVEGFTQNSNYSKAQVSAQQQIADASNTAMARFQRDVRNSQIRDQHTPSPLSCAALDNGQTVIVGSGQSWRVAKAIQDVNDNRGEANANTPAFYGSAQAIASNNDYHSKFYCSQTEADAGLCQLSATPNADQRASSLFGTGTYNGQQGINDANAYAMTLIQPIVPAALRGSQLTSTMGEEARVRRREYNARVSLARNTLNYVMAAQTQSIPLSTEQQQEMADEGLPASQNGSWLQGLTLDVNRRYGSLNYAAQLAAMTPAAIQREVAQELALTNYLLLHNYRLGMMTASTNATQLAAEAERSIQPTPMPTPSIVAN